jgi:hypothetical protein
MQVIEGLEEPNRSACSALGEYEEQDDTHSDDLGCCGAIRGLAF